MERRNRICNECGNRTSEQTCEICGRKTQVVKETTYALSKQSTVVFDDENTTTKQEFRTHSQKKEQGEFAFHSQERTEYDAKEPEFDHISQTGKQTRFDHIPTSPFVFKKGNETKNVKESAIAEQMDRLFHPYRAHDKGDKEGEWAYKGLTVDKLKGIAIILIIILFLVIRVCT